MVVLVSPVNRPSPVLRSVVADSRTLQFHSSDNASNDGSPSGSAGNRSTNRSSCRLPGGIKDQFLLFLERPPPGVVDAVSQGFGP